MSYSNDDDHLSNLIPIPVTEEAIHYVAQRVSEEYKILYNNGIAMENMSYYAAPGRKRE